MANQRLLKIEKLFEMDGPSVWSTMCHSNGLNRLTRNSTTLTPRYENTIHIQISDDNGFMNENTPGSSFIGFCLSTNNNTSIDFNARIARGLEKGEAGGVKPP